MNSDIIKNKKVLYTAIFILVLIILAIVLTWKPWATKQASTTNISDIQALSPVLSLDNQDIYYYDLQDLNLFKYNLKTKKKNQLSQGISDKPLDLSWSPDRTSVIMKYYYEKAGTNNSNSVFNNQNITDGSTVLVSYNLSNQKLTLLDTRIFTDAGLSTLNPIWTADSKNIIYYSVTGNKNSTISIANPDGTNAQVLGQGPSKDSFYSFITYESNNKVMYYDSYSTETNLYNIYKFNLTTQENQELFVGYQTALPINDHQFVISDDNNSYIYDISTQKIVKLPVLAQEQKTAVSADRTKLIIITNNQKRDIFNIVNVSNQSIIKRAYNDNPLSSYDGLNLGDNNIFYVIDNQLTETKIK